MKNQRHVFSISVFCLFSFFSFCQERPYEIFGTITGRFKSKMYLFFEDNYRQRDSISSEIKNGKFYFKGNVSMPILARLHMDQTSLIADFYLDGEKTYVKCTNTIRLDGKDTSNLLTISSVEGPSTGNIVTEFDSWSRKLQQSNKNQIEKANAYYDKLFGIIKKHPKSKISPYLLSKAASLSYSQVTTLQSLIDTSLRNSFEGRSVQKLLAQLETSPNSEPGEVFHDVVLKDINGNEVATKQFRGKYTLVVFWASWCGPCRRENPDLNKLYSKYKERGFEIMGVSIDADAEKWKEAILKDRLKWTQLLDPAANGGELVKFYNIEGIPATFLLDTQGKIIGTDMPIREIEKMLNKFL